MVAKPWVKIIESQTTGVNFKQEGVVRGAFIDMIMRTAAKLSYSNDGHKRA